MKIKVTLKSTGKSQIHTFDDKIEAYRYYNRLNDSEYWTVEYVDDDGRPYPEPETEELACDPLYGQRMDSADMGEC